MHHRFVFCRNLPPFLFLSHVYSFSSYERTTACSSTKWDRGLEQVCVGAELAAGHNEHVGSAGEHNEHADTTLNPRLTRMSTWYTGERRASQMPGSSHQPCMHQGSLEYALLWHDPVPFTAALFFAEMARIPAGHWRGGGSEFDADSHVLEPLQPLNASTVTTMPACSQCTPRRPSASCSALSCMRHRPFRAPVLTASSSSPCSPWHTSLDATGSSGAITVRFRVFFMGVVTTLPHLEHHVDTVGVPLILHQQPYLLPFLKPNCPSRPAPQRAMPRALCYGVIVSWQNTVVLVEAAKLK
jgi:hypothetical protein